VSMQAKTLTLGKRPRFGDHPFPVINPSQLGGIETSVLDNGPGRGVRIAWVNTGGGLRYKVVIDRGLDIADAEFKGQSLTWHSLTGVTAPNHAYETGLDWLRSFFGGLVVSCGPLSAGAPCHDAGQDLSLHGTHSNTPATVEFITSPDPARDRCEMNVTGVVRTARVFGPNVELRRTISSTLGDPTIRIYDQFCNRGNQSVEHAWLLHINFGYPLLEPGASTYCYKGKITPRAGDEAYFAGRKNYRKAPNKPLENHRGGGEVFTYVAPKADAVGEVTCGVVNEKRGLGVRITYNNQDYPRLGNWQHWGPGGSFVGALEPMNNGVDGRDVDRERGWLAMLEPGQIKEYRCAITATDKPKDLDRLLRLNR